MPYTIPKDGDDFEKVSWNRFLKTEFPSYEKYWSTKVVPLTNRPANIFFRSSAELLQSGHTAEEVCNAQLHYTNLRRLSRSFAILEWLKNNSQNTNHTNLLAEGHFQLVAAQDVAFEFLQRLKTPNKFDPWTPKKESKEDHDASFEARRKWQKENNYPLNPIRVYRNHLAHGRLSPHLGIGNKVYAPKMGKENNYLDWRIVIDWKQSNAVLEDFDSLDNILEKAWKETISYFENEWKKIIY